MLFLGSIGLAVVNALLRAWGLMFGVALVHVLWAPRLHTLGFWWALALSACVGLASFPTVSGDA